MNPQQLKIEDFNYELPNDQIAFYPLAQRDASRLLIYKEREITEDIYRNIAQHLPENALLIFNDTRVVEARILFQKSTGGTIEIFCLAPHAQYPDITSAMMQRKKVWWQCLIGGASKWRRGTILEKKIEIESGTVSLHASIIERLSDIFIVEMEWKPESMSFAEVLHYAGVIPLPPYIKRRVETSDIERYQTIYAKQQGSVAAPTAGLHFTGAIFQSMKEACIDWDFVTLHVGAGTFKPVMTKYMRDHNMHSEFIDVRYETIEKLADRTGNIFCIGTTSLRTVESLYWLGVKVKNNPALEVEELLVTQWEGYDNSGSTQLAADTALHALLQWMNRRKMKRLICQTGILIVPGYSFRMIAGLVTNFHQPKSTLLLLVAALIGADWKEVYRYALQNKFRFLSYGDGCLFYAAANTGVDKKNEDQIGCDGDLS